MRRARAGGRIKVFGGRVHHEGGVLDDKIETTASAIIDAAMKIHRMYGPGLLENVYEECLAYELAKRRHLVVRQHRVPIFYDNIELATPLRIDLLVDDCVIVEVKAVDALLPLFEAQCLTYLRLTKRKLCILINFNVELLKDGIRRVIN